MRASSSAEPLRTRSLLQDVGLRLRRSPAVIIGALVVGLIVLSAVAAPLISARDPVLGDLHQQTVSPSWQHLFGTDKLGRDIFTRILYGARTSTTIGFVAVGLAMSVGVAIGLAAGYVGGRLDSLLMGAMDVMLAFPSIVLAIGITYVLGASIGNLMLAIGIVNIPQYARLARGQVLVVKRLEYVEAARAIGSGPVAIIARHVLPNILAPLLVQATLGIATAELDAAGLSYLGLGARPPAPEWGAMLNDARDYWVSAPWALLAPGISISILVLGFNLLGDGLRDALDPAGR